MTLKTISNKNSNRLLFLPCFITSHNNLSIFTFWMNDKPIWQSWWSGPFVALKARKQPAGKFPLMIKQSQILALSEICVNSMTSRPCSLLSFLGGNYEVSLALLLGREIDLQDGAENKWKYFSVQGTCFNHLSLLKVFFLLKRRHISDFIFLPFLKKSTQVTLFPYHPSIFFFVP